MAGAGPVHGEEPRMDRGRWKLLLQRPHRRQLWRAAFGAYLFAMLAAGGVHAVPRWIEDVVNPALFALALWLVFSAGQRFGASVVQQEVTNGRRPTHFA